MRQIAGNYASTYVIYQVMFCHFKDFKGSTKAIVLQGWTENWQDIIQMHWRDLEHRAVGWMVICRAWLPAGVPPILLQVTWPSCRDGICYTAQIVSGDVVVTSRAFGFLCKVKFLMRTGQMWWYENVFCPFSSLATTDTVAMSRSKSWCRIKQNAFAI